MKKTLLKLVKTRFLTKVLKAISLSSGSADIYELKDGTWLENQKLMASDSAELAWFGSSVSVSEDKAIVGAFMANDINGSAYIYELRHGIFGSSVSISGNKVIVGAPQTMTEVPTTKNRSSYIFCSDEVTGLLGVSLYTNPTTDLLNLEVQNDEITQVDLMNLPGEIINTIEGNTIALDVSGLPSGIYLLQIQTQNWAAHSRFVKG